MFCHVYNSVCHFKITEKIYDIIFEKNKWNYWVKFKTPILKRKKNPSR